MADGVDKGAALTAMAELSSIPLAETAAFGDFLNDYELLRTAGLAVAMDNAHPQLKEIADIIAPQCRQWCRYGTAGPVRRCPNQRFKHFLGSPNLGENTPHYFRNPYTSRAKPIQSLAAIPLENVLKQF